MRRATASALASVLLALPVAGCGDDDPVSVGAFPAPGTQTASPTTEISFRGAGADDLGDVEVVGSRTGEHAGRLVEHADGDGASFVAEKPFRGGETVTVRTTADVVGAREGDFRFKVVPRPKEGLGSDRPPSRGMLRQLLGQAGEVPEDAVPQYRSRPDLRPPEVEIRKKPTEQTEDGLIFLSPKKVFGARERPGLQSGPMIADEQGQPIWFANLDDGNVNDFRVQEVKGKRYLTFWAGRQVLGSGEGEIRMLDERYREVQRIKGGNGYKLDFHETTLTPEGTALVLVYNPVDWDLSEVGGPKDGRIIDAVVQEIEIETGRVLFEWHSAGNVGLDESYAEVPEDRGQPFDYFHANSVTLDDDGNLLVSGRETWSVVKLDRRTGRIMWRLGGKRSDFDMQGEAQFGYQHDAQRDPDGTIRIFDNAAAPKTRPQSRVLNLELDEEAKTAKVVRQFEHPEDLSSGTQGNSQRLPDGNVFVGWGSQGYFSEFSRDGQILFDGRVARGSDTYRAYRMPWTGRPAERPALAFEPTDEGLTVWASWNGSTELAAWQVLAGDAADALEPVGEPVQRDGFETQLEVDGAPAYVAVRALDAEGEELGTSEPQLAEDDGAYR